MKLLHINVHRSVDTPGPFFAVVDDVHHGVLSSLRWLTTSNTKRPIRSFYSKELGRPATVSLARFVWKLNHPTKDLPDNVGHLDGDLLNCTAANLVELSSSCRGDISNTGKILEKFDTDVVVYRNAHQLPLGGLRVATGRPLPATEQQIATLRELRQTVGKDMSLDRFNAEIVAVELGRELSWRGLKRILS